MVLHLLLRLVIFLLICLRLLIPLCLILPRVVDINPDQQQRVRNPEPVSPATPTVPKWVEYKSIRTAIRTAIRTGTLRSRGDSRTGSGFSRVTSERTQRRGAFMGQSTEGSLGAAPLTVRDLFICRPG